MINKKIIIVGNDQLPAIEIYFQKYLKLHFNEVAIFNPNIFFKFNLLFKIRRKLEDRSLFNKINKELINYAIVEKPEIIWIFKGIEIHLQTLKALKSLGIKLINFNADHPFQRIFTSNGGKIIENALPYFDLHFSYSKSIVDKINLDYQIPCERLPFGFELSDDEFINLSNQPETLKLCFIGNPDKKRADILIKIAKAGLQIDIYGYKWDRWIKSVENINVYDLVLGNDYWKTLNKYRVQLNLFRPYNIGSHNMRTFEIPAIGGIQLANNSEENHEFFEDGKEIFQFSNLEELIEKAKYLLELPQHDAKTIRNSARNRCVDSGYSYQNRISNAVDSLKLIEW